MYSRTVDGEVLEFGTSGLLYQSNKLMYDRSTRSLWHQFLGEPVLGPLADSEIRLELHPVLVTDWEEWAHDHPDTTVLDIDTGIFPPEAYQSETDPDSSYYDYRQTEDTLYPVRDRSNTLPTKAEVLGLSLNGEARAYPLELLHKNPVLNDSLGGLNIVVLTQQGSGSVRAYERGTRAFPPPHTGENASELGASLLDGDGRLWAVLEEALVLAEDPDTSFRRLPSHMAYWFGWFSFYPGTDVYGVGSGEP